MVLPVAQLVLVVLVLRYHRLLLDQVQAGRDHLEDHKNYREAIGLLEILAHFEQVEHKDISFDILIRNLFFDRFR